jgi:hypothetical protein
MEARTQSSGIHAEIAIEGVLASRGHSASRLDSAHLYGVNKS